MSLNLRDQPFELGAHLGCGPRLDVRAVLTEQDEVDLVAGAFLVAQQRFPGAIGVDGYRLRRKPALHFSRVPTRETKRREQPEGHGLAVWKVEVRRGFERVTKGVTQVQMSTHATIVRILETETSLVRRGAAN